MRALLPYYSRYGGDLAAAWLALLLTACAAPASDPERTETPVSPIVLEQIAFEERQEGQIIWEGTARSSAGDLQRLELQDLQLVRKPQAPGESSLQLTTPRAQLDLQAHEGVFAPILVTLSDGSELRAPAADYREARGTLEITGPVELTGPRLQLRASAATLYLEDGRVEVAGPVTGVTHAPAPAGW